MKLLLTLAVIVAAWFVLKKERKAVSGTVGRVIRAFNAGKQAMQDSARAREVDDASPRDPRQAVDLKPCPRCGAYVAVGAACTCTKA